MTGMSLPLVTAVITTHNRLDLLQRAVQSVLAQTYPAMELVVVDDASTDGTAAWCEVQPFCFIHIPPEESRGGNHARNVGIEAARGEYVAFLDDDDRWLPEKIRKQVEVAQATGCALVYCGRRDEVITKNGSSFRDKIPATTDCGDMSRKILYTFGITTSTILARRDELLEAGLFDEDLRYWQDYEMLIRLAQKVKFGVVAEPLCLYWEDRRDKSRLSNKFFEWKKTVAHIQTKHEMLYDKLSNRERLYMRVLIWRDAARRSLVCALYLRFLLYGCATAFGKLVLKVWPA